VQITTILCHWYFRWTSLQTATSRPTFAKGSVKIYAQISLQSLKE
jgi:hypothetical protein